MLVKEVLIADDGSTDGSRELIEGYVTGLSNKIRYIQDKAPLNIGAHARLNQLCKLATQPWIAVLNSDDEFGGGRFVNVAPLSKMYKNNAFFGRIIIVDSYGREIGHKNPGQDLQFDVPDSVRRSIGKEGFDWLHILLSQNVVATTSNLVFTKALFERIGGFRDYRYIHDWDFALRAAFLGELRCNPAMTTYYRLHGSNTIKEDGSKVDAEARKMFEQIFLEFKESEKLRDRVVEEMLKSNQYLAKRATCPFALVLPPVGAEIASERFKEAFPRGEIVNDARQLPDDIKVVWMPKNGNNSPSVNLLRNGALSATYGDYDFVFMSNTFKNHASIPKGVHLYDVTFFSRQTLPDGVRFSPLKRGRLVQIPKGGEATRIENISFDLKSYDRSIIAGEGRTKNARISPLPDGALSTGAKNDLPVVFVFPGFVAIGGAENITFSVMDALSLAYQFVVVCTERLQEAFGSWVSRAEELSIAFYDLSECVDDEDRLPILSHIVDLYKPELAFITNGTVWQMRHAASMRKTLKNVRVIDQQVYDTDVGWINWFQYPEIRNFDMYIAINRRIENTFVSRYKIPPSKVDMIYHPINSKRIVAFKAMLDPKSRQRYLEKFNLKPAQRRYVIVGRLISQKRPDKALEFIREYSKTHHLARQSR
jgi:GT2 family glycosyltransferase